MKKAVIGLVIASSLLVNVSVAEFSDVPTTHWAYSNIEKMQDAGIITGYVDGSFKPSSDINLAEFATIFTRIFEIPKDSESNYFVDVPSTHWAKGSIEAVRKYVNPYYDSIGEALDTSKYSCMNEITADLGMTREAFVYAVSAIYGYAEEEYVEGEEKIFEDYKEILFPKEIVLAYKNGIIKGEIVDGKTYIRPTRYITRAEASTIFRNLLNNEDDRVRNEDQDKELISAVDSMITKLKGNDFEGIKSSIYDTAQTLADEHFAIPEENIKPLKEVINKYFKNFKYEVIETGFNGFNNGYVKVKIKGYNVKQEIKDIFNDMYLKLDTEAITTNINEFIDNFSNGIKKKIIKAEEREEIFNFVKQDGEWKLWIQQIN